MEAVAFGGRDINGGGGPRNELDFNATSNDYNRVRTAQTDSISLFKVLIEDLRVLVTRRDCDSKAFKDYTSLLFLFGVSVFIVRPWRYPNTWSKR